MIRDSGIGKGRRSWFVIRVSGIGKSEEPWIVIRGSERRPSCGLIDLFNLQCLFAYPFLNSSPFKNRPFLIASSAFPFPGR